MVLPDFLGRNPRSSFLHVNRKHECSNVRGVLCITYLKVLLMVLPSYRVRVPYLTLRAVTLTNQAWDQQCKRTASLLIKAAVSSVSPTIPHCLLRHRLSPLCKPRAQLLSSPFSPFRSLYASLRKQAIPRHCPLRTLFYCSSSSTPIRSLTCTILPSRDSTRLTSFGPAHLYDPLG